MAIISSMGVGRSKKSMGNVTYRVVRGRTIGSQKRGAGATGATTRGLTGNIRKPLFAMISSFMKAHDTDIQVSFNKSQYGSQRNYFFAQNYGALSAALQALAVSAAASGVMPLESEVEAAITAYATANPTAIYRVKLAGFDNVFMDGAWDSNDNPVSGGSSDGLGTGTVDISDDSDPLNSVSYSAPIALSLSLHAGAKIVHAFSTMAVIKAAALPAGITSGQITYYSGNIPLATQPTISNVTSVTGQLTYSVTSVAEASNVTAVKVGNMYLRLTSAYVKAGDNPLG